MLEQVTILCPPNFLQKFQNLLALKNAMNFSCPHPLNFILTKAKVEFD